MHRSIQSFKIPPNNSRAFDPWLAEAGNLDRTSQVCPAEKTCFTLKYRRLKVKSSPSRVNGSEKGLQGLGFKVWRIGRKSRSLFLPCRKKKTYFEIRPLGGTFEHNRGPEGRYFKRTKVNRFKRPRGLRRERVLKLRIDRRVNQGNPLQCNLETM